jgi:hypothetical protein
MKDFRGIASNVYYTKGAEGKLIPQVEMIILCGEPKYEHVNGQIVKKYETSELRLGAPIGAVKEILSQFTEELTKAEKEVERDVINGFK